MTSWPPRASPERGELVGAQVPAAHPEETKACCSLQPTQTPTRRQAGGFPDKQIYSFERCDGALPGSWALSWPLGHVSK